jgi:myosin heavy subunit
VRVNRSVQAEYEAEGIELDEITFEDNAPILELIEGRMGCVEFALPDCFVQ